MELSLVLRSLECLVILKHLQQLLSLAEPSLFWEVLQVQFSQCRSMESQLSKHSLLFLRDFKLQMSILQAGLQNEVLM